MNRSDFLNMIGNTVPINRQMIGEIYEMIDIFPYFQSAHLLLLKALNDNADIKSENQLRNSAIHIADREVLYWRLNRVAPVKQETEEIIPRVEVTSDSRQTVIETARNSELMIDDIEKSAQHTGERTIEKISHPVLIIADPGNTPAEVIVLNEEDTSQPDEKVFYMDPGISFSESPDLLELEIEENETTLDLDEITQEIAPEPEKNRKQIQSELIDKFIIANPRIEPQKDKSLVSNEDLSRPFTEESGGLVTETLAKIYVCQGYYSKAIEIYEKLSLKFPEKSSYFASQIEKVKEYIKK